MERYIWESFQRTPGVSDNGEKGPKEAEQNH